MPVHEPSRSAHPPLQPLPVHCEICGYDIHGNPAARCPECGGTPAARRNWLVQQQRRQPRWILAGRGWIVLISIGVSVLAAALAALARFLDS